jgi:hypothetical protein
MTNLYIEHDGLRGLSRAVHETSTDAGSLAVAIRDTRPELADGGLLQHFAGAMEKANAWGTDTLDRITKTGWALSSGIDDANALYMHTDQAQARRFDAVYRPAQSGDPAGSLPSPRSAGKRFTAVESVDGALNHSGFADISDFKYQYNLMTDTLSPSMSIRELAIALLGKDPFEWFLRGINGDWDHLWTAGRAYLDVASALHAVEANFRVYGSDLPAVWRGRAAADCDEYLMGFAVGVGGQAQVFDAIGKKFQTVAKECWAMFDAMAGALGEIIDLLIELAVVIGFNKQIASAKVALKKRVGTAIAAFLIISVLKLMDDAETYWGRATTIISDGVAAVQGLGSHDIVLGVCPAVLPAAPYAGPTRHSPYGPRFVGPQPTY